MERAKHRRAVAKRFIEFYTGSMNYVKLYADLDKLNDDQLKVLAETDAPVPSMGHDIRGIATREPYFLPKIQELLPVTKFIERED